MRATYPIFGQEVKHDDDKVVEREKKRDQALPHGVEMALNNVVVKLSLAHGEEGSDGSSKMDLRWRWTT